MFDNALNAVKGFFLAVTTIAVSAISPGPSPTPEPTPIVIVEETPSPTPTVTPTPVPTLRPTVKPTVVPSSTPYVQASEEVKNETDEACKENYNKVKDKIAEFREIDEEAVQQKINEREEAVRKMNEKCATRYGCKPIELKKPGEFGYSKPRVYKNGNDPERIDKLAKLIRELDQAAADCLN